MMALFVVNCMLCAAACCLVFLVCWSVVAVCCCMFGGFGCVSLLFVVVRCWLCVVGRWPLPVVCCLLRAFRCVGWFGVLLRVGVLLFVVCGVVVGVC